MLSNTLPSRKASAQSAPHTEHSVSFHCMQSLTHTPQRFRPSLTWPPHSFLSRLPVPPAVLLTVETGVSYSALLNMLCTPSARPWTFAQTSRKPRGARLPALHCGYIHPAYRFLGGSLNPSTGTNSSTGLPPLSHNFLHYNPGHAAPTQSIRGCVCVLNTYS